MSEYEKRTIEMEAARNSAADKYFDARPHLHKHKEPYRLFEAGFERAWESPRSPSCPMCDDFIAGATAMKDGLLMIIVNHFGGSAESEKRCQRENELFNEWVEDTFYMVAEDK